MTGSFDLLHVVALWVAIPLAFIPAGMNWWWGRSLASGDSATRPERHLAIAQRVSSATVVCSIVIGVTAGWMAIAIIPLELLMLSWTTHRVRRSLFGETWSFAQYVLWRVRLVAGIWAFWWFLALMPPALASSSPPTLWWMAAIATTVALLWHHWYSRILLVVFAASPLSRPDLDAAFEEILRRARIPPPRLWRAGEERAVFANALAIPSVRGNNVLFFPTLLERLSTAEIAGVLAHEIAHLEHYTPRIRRLYATGAALVVLLIASGVAAALYAPGSAWWILLASFIAVFAGLSLRAQRMQPRETEADLRAVELSQDPDALINGLIRLHAINHVPRRWSAQFEEHASHPSLAGRIRAIRSHADPPRTHSAVERIIITSPEPERVLILEAARVGFLWCAGDISPNADLIQRARRADVLAYTELRELRLVPTSRGTMVRAVSHVGRRWTMPIHEQDAARIQDALDRIDHLIVAQPRRTAPIGGRLTAATIVLMASVFNGSLVTFAPVLLALRHPSRPLLTGIAATLTVAALLTANEARISWSNMIILAIVAAGALWAARRRAEPARDDQHAAWFWVERAALAIPVVAGLTLVSIHADTLFDLHTAVRDRPWLSAAAAGLAAFLGTSDDRSSRRAGMCAGLVSAAALWIGSPWFLLGVVRDPLAVEMPVLAEEHMPLTMIERRDVEGAFESISLAPDGDTALLAADEEDDGSEQPRPRRYAVSHADGVSRTFRASAAVLVDRDRVLVLERDTDHSRLHADEVRTGQQVWRVTLPFPDITDVQVAPDGRWRALARHEQRFIRIEGRLGASETRDIQWTMRSTPDSYIDAPRLDEGPIALGVATSWHRPRMQWIGASWSSTTTLLHTGPNRTRPIASSRLNVDCTAPPLGTHGFVCVSFDGRWSRVWRLDAGSTTLTPIGQVRGAFWRLRQESSTAIDANLPYGAAVIALDSGTMRTFTPPWDGCGMDDFAHVRDIVAASCIDGDTTRVTLYRANLD